MGIQTRLMICSLMISKIHSDGYDLKELINAPDHPVTTDLASMYSIQRAISVLMDAYGEESSIFSPTRYFVNKYQLPPRQPSSDYLPRLDTNEQEAYDRERPAYTISFKNDSEIFLFVAGASVHSPHYDVQNLVDAYAKDLTLRKFSNKEIQVHDGIFRMVNTKEFYVQLLDDLHLMINRAHETGNGAKYLSYVGYSQGGAIVTLLSVLWKADADCEFVNYFQENASKELKLLMDKSKVITAGGASSIGNTVHGANLINDKLGDDIINVINPKDIVPMVFNGETMEPQHLLRDDKNLMTYIYEYFGSEPFNTLVENYHDIQWYGPVGNYLAILRNKDGQIVFRSLNPSDTPKLYQEHLVHGGSTLSDLSLNRWQLMFTTLAEHSCGSYVNRFSEGVDYYKNKLQESHGL